MQAAAGSPRVDTSIYFAIILHLRRSLAAVDSDD